MVHGGPHQLEYMIQVRPTGRHKLFSVEHLKMVLEVTLPAVFMPSAGFNLREKPSLNYLYAGARLLDAMLLRFCAPAP